MLTLKELVFGKSGCEDMGGGVGWDALKGKEEEEEQEEQEEEKEEEVQDRS